MQFIPREVSIYGVYFSPYLLAAILGVALAALTVLLLNRYRLSRFFYFPPIIFLSMAVMYTLLVGTFLVPM